MNYIIILILLLSNIYAQNNSEYGKIDMHGGKKTSLYSNEKSTFKSPSMGMSNFLDDNQTKTIEKDSYKKSIK